MKARKIQPIFNDLTPHQSFRLDVTLADFLPKSTAPTILPSTQSSAPLPIPHHLVYFEPTKPSSVMLADGTNPDQSPGDPFVRRMWAGGRVLYNEDKPFYLNGGRAVCAEFIQDVSFKGREGQEKVFVGVERRHAMASEDEISLFGSAVANEQAQLDLDHKIRQRLWRDQGSDFGPCCIVETRNIVFMRSRTEKEAAVEAQKAKDKILKPQHNPDWSYTITPDPKLLFRFSALTFNAHAIHLDPQYSKDVEGHRERLLHGPLSYTFMVSLLQRELRRLGDERITQVEYRNLAPLYCNEPVTFCGAKTGDHKWEIWTQTPEGGIAVKGTAMTG